MTEQIINYHPGKVLPDECCPDWYPQIDKLNTPILIQFARSGGTYKFDGKPFVFCPWCGKKRTP